MPVWLEAAVGYLAACLTTGAFVPQVWYCWKTRDTRSISLGMYCLFCTGVLLWLVYGVMVEQWPVVAANAVTLALASSILWLKIRDRQVKP
ncbi:MAG TPA: SemiSWEET transporter [Limnobacter sp.]|uniref:SemiSWEET transporter n=1 Tax=Limnobacter sp. TaxID=2003368 RepID=UPI002ED7AD12